MQYPNKWKDRLMSISDNQDGRSMVIEKIRLEEKSLIKEIRRSIKQIEIRENRKMPSKGRIDLEQKLMQRHVKTLRKRYGINENTGRPIGESLDDFQSVQMLPNNQKQISSSRDLPLLDPFENLFEFLRRGRKQTPSSFIPDDNEQN